MPSLFEQRVEIYRKIEEARGSRVIGFVTGDRAGMQTQIANDAVDVFGDYLDEVFPTRKISLVLYTLGGNTLAAWNIINMLRMFCDELEVIVPNKARSSGTLICLGAEKIIMTKQATLGPIDPSLNGPLNPQIPGAAPDARSPVSVESVKGYLEMARKDFGIKSGADMAKVLIDLSSKVHPLVLGSIFRSKGQIQFLAGELLKNQVRDAGTKRKIINFLCSESGSHDYTINRREALSLGLNVEKPSADLYALLRDWLNNIRQELQLTVPFDPNMLIGTNSEVSYTCTRCLFEGTANKPSSVYVSEGKLIKVPVPHPQLGLQELLQDNRTFEGWRERS